MVDEKQIKPEPPASPPDAVCKNTSRYKEEMMCVAVLMRGHMPTSRVFFFVILFVLLQMIALRVTCYAPTVTIVQNHSGPFRLD